MYEIIYICGDVPTHISKSQVGGEKMILEEETYEKFGYYPNDFAPHSHKPVLATCDNCGKIRQVQKRISHHLCHSCGVKRNRPDVTGENNPMFGRHHTDKTIEKMRNANRCLRGRHHSLEHCANISKALEGRKHPNWKGGISFEPYCPKFNNTLKEVVRDNFGRKCYLCPKTEEENGRKLDVHHVDYNKEQGCNGINWLLVPLCRSCNSKVNHNREYWQNFITEKMRKDGYL